MTKKHISAGLISILATGCEPISIELEIDQETKDYVSDNFGEEGDIQHPNEPADNIEDHSGNQESYPIEQDVDIEQKEDEEEVSSDEQFEEIYEEESEEIYNEDIEDKDEEDTCGDDYSVPIQGEHTALWIQTDYSQHSNPLNTRLYGSSEAAEILIAQNIDWDFVRMDEISFHPEFLVNYDIIILYGQGHLGPLSDVDAAVLEYWVLQGGGLMYHTFHPTEATCDMLNSLSYNFGIQCVSDGTPINGMGSPVIDHPINNDIQEVHILGGESLSIQSPAQSIIEDAIGNTFVATVEWGYGRIVAINDEWPLYNAGTGTADISTGDNNLMLDNAFCWLSGNCNDVQSLDTGFECDMSKNFILGVHYSQISLTDGCQLIGDVVICDANPIYHETTDLELAADYCQDICKEDEECNGYFFQKHQNGHEICGFYSEVVDLDDAIWHGHQEGSRVCKKN